MNCKNSLDENGKNVYDNTIMWFYAKSERGELRG